MCHLSNNMVNRRATVLFSEDLKNLNEFEKQSVSFLTFYVVNNPAFKSRLYVLLFQSVCSGDLKQYNPKRRLDTD